MIMSSVHDDVLFSVAYVLFHVIFECMRVLCTAEAARCIASSPWHGPPRFALIGGLNLTVALGLQVTRRQAPLRPASVPRVFAVCFT